MKRKPETTAYVQKFVTDMNAMGRPHCFRTDNGGEFTSHRYVDYCDSVGILLLRLGRDPSQIHGSGQAATKRGRRECDLALDKRWPCGTLRDSTTFPGRTLHRHPQHQRQRQLSEAGGCSLGRGLLQPLSDQGEHRIAVAARGVLPATDGPVGGALLPGRHDAGGPRSEIRRSIGGFLFLQ